MLYKSCKDLCCGSSDAVTLTVSVIFLSFWALFWLWVFTMQKIWAFFLLFTQNWPYFHKFQSAVFLSKQTWTCDRIILCYISKSRPDKLFCNNFSSVTPHFSHVICVHMQLIITKLSQFSYLCSCHCPEFHYLNYVTYNSDIKWVLEEFVHTLIVRINSAYCSMGTHDVDMKGQSVWSVDVS